MKTISPFILHCPDLQLVIFLVWTRYEWLIVELKRVAKKLYYNDNVTLSTFYIYIIISDIFAIEIKISALSEMSLLQ